MPYDQAIKDEAAYANSLGLNATEDRFHATYSGILTHWFPTSLGYVMDHQVMGVGGKPKYIIIRHTEGKRNPVLIVELKRPNKWTTAGKNEVLDDLTTYIEGRFEYNAIYGVGGIGLHWIVYKMEKSGDVQLSQVQGWTDDIASDTSYTEFETISSLVYNIT